MRIVDIAVTDSKTQKKYKNKSIEWNALLERFVNPIRTSETAEEFAKMSKSRREELKDHGGLVAGKLRGGSRKSENVIHLSFGMLDFDSIPEDVNFLKLIRTALPGMTWFIHTTHSHTLENQRYRLAVLFSRNVSPDEAPPILRKIAERVGMELVDPCSFECNRMMYFPSCSTNGVYDFQRQDGQLLDVDAILAEYDDWRDCSQWATTKSESEAVKREINRQQDPLEKSGLIGAFCRVYTVDDVIESLLDGVYESTTQPDRYTYCRGESHGGLVVYEHGKFAYSHHATDPACGKLLNAFDLYRIHRFGDLDDKSSVKAMLDYAGTLDAVKLKLNAEKVEEAKALFEEAADWRRLLKYQTRSSVLENSVWNAMLILNNDPDFANFAYNELANRIQLTGDVPWERPPDNKYWRDADTAQLKALLDTRYVPFSSRNHDVSFTKIADDRRFHPIRDYLNGLPLWDGVSRIETLLIRCLQADDTPYVRAVTRKTFAAAVARIYKPGTKFDSVLVFDGAQGIGKSTLFKDLVGEEFYSETLSLTDMDDKCAAEKLQGFWIVEIGELAGMKKADVERVKSFLSTADDKYRPSYGKTVESHPRQCVIIGSVNGERGYLRDVTGNRRFWIVKCHQEVQIKRWSFAADERDQIWAEAKHLWQSSERLYLEGELITAAAEAQREAMEVDERQGMVEKYLDTLLPDTWETMSIYERRSYISDPDNPTRPIGTVRRETVSNAEIWCECFGRNLSELKPTDSYALAALMTKVDGWERCKEFKRLSMYGKQRLYKRR